MISYFIFYNLLQWNFDLPCAPSTEVHPNVHPRKRERREGLTSSEGFRARLTSNTVPKLYGLLRLGEIYEGT